LGETLGAIFLERAIALAVIWAKPDSARLWIFRRAFLVCLGARNPLD
jgi:hypothetical protein